MSLRPPESGGLLGLLAAPLFVFLWSTGFIGAKLGMPHAEPMTFLTLRQGGVVLLLGAAALLLRAAWPPPSDWPRIARIGVLMHGAYLGGVFTAISLGLNAGLAALIASLSPLATAALGRGFFGETSTKKQLFGMALGLGGVALAVVQRLEASWADLPAVALCLCSALAMAWGALEQRALGATPFLSSNAIQYLAATAFCGVCVAVFETGRVDWTGEFAFALGWLILVLSIGAVGLFQILLRRGAAAEATSLLFLTPPAAALIAWPLFGETLTYGAMAGFALASLGVALTTGRL